MHVVYGEDERIRELVVWVCDDYIAPPLRRYFAAMHRGYTLL